MGAFQISSLPEHDATLFLAMYRRDAKTSAVSFASHTFSSLLNAQVAVLDTYRGQNKNAVQVNIADAGNSERKNGRKEEVQFDTVVAVNPGRFEAQLEEGAEKSKMSVKKAVSFSAVDRENYVVLRVGTEGNGLGKEFGEDLLVFPQTESFFSTKAATTMFSNMWGSVKRALFATV